MNTILGTKLGMSQIFSDSARALPVTVIKAGPCRVVQVKTADKDGYEAVQLTLEVDKSARVNKAVAGHFAKAGWAPSPHLVEAVVDDSAAFQAGSTITVEEIFEAGLRADVTGVSKGKGFAGSDEAPQLLRPVRQPRKPQEAPRGRGDRGLRHSVASVQGQAHARSDGRSAHHRAQPRSGEGAARGRSDPPARGRARTQGWMVMVRKAVKAGG